MGLKSVLSVAAAMVLGATAWASDGAAKPAAGGAAKAATGQQYTIGLVAKSQDNPVFVAARAGAEAAAIELGKKYGVEIKIDWQTPVGEDAQKQADLITALVARGAAGIAVSASDAAKLKNAIDNAVDKGIPVVTFDSDVPGSKRFAYFGTDDFEAGAALANEIKTALGGKGVIAILAGNQNAPNLQARVRGVRETLKKIAPEISVLNTYYHEETPQDAVKKIEEVQAGNPQITGWVFVGGWPLYTQNALDSLRGKAKVVSLDTLPPTLPYLLNGDVEVLLGQKYFGWGTESVRLLMENILEGKTPEKPMVNAPLDRVTKENAVAYGKNWDTWLGKKPEEKKEGK
ncbi:MAG: substrate-binding domain-containing protein [Phycisphaerales bacterium]|jgi:ribose transport system substrate-binding protein|nr:substrate-binding domain-containing protein [Phycisphaerales bacterium]